MEIKLTSTRLGGDFRGRSVFLCAPALRRKIDLPKGVQAIYAVFTKASPNEDSFTIHEPKMGGDWSCSGKNTQRSRIKEWGGQLSWRTEKVLARQYEQGYRYVNFDYEVPE
ncbi:hypothetical protein LCGC14_0373620 [marine sediment metagenome]|uniref:Uncharacterized protein n=1 Tax=marine sediment metagenome TaxID=412755 RepID=A0A0F9TMK0_9ZZZZ